MCTDWLLNEYEFYMDEMEFNNFSEEMLGFASGNTYTISWEIGSNPYYKNNGGDGIQTVLKTEESEFVPPKIVVFNDHTEVYLTSTKAVDLHPQSGDVISAVFTCGDLKSGKVYLNGDLIADNLSISDYWLFYDEIRIPYQIINEFCQLCVVELKVKLGDRP